MTKIRRLKIPKMHWKDSRKWLFNKRPKVIDDLYAFQRLPKVRV